MAWSDSLGLARRPWLKGTWIKGREGREGKDACMTQDSTHDNWAGRMEAGIWGLTGQSSLLDLVSQERSKAKFQHSYDLGR